MKEKRNRKPDFFLLSKLKSEISKWEREALDPQNLRLEFLAEQVHCVWIQGKEEMTTPL